MAVAFVQKSSEITITATTSGNAALTVTGGNLMVCFVTSINDNGARSYTVTDSKSNTWTRIALASNPANAAIHYAPNIANGATTITVTVDSGLSGNCSAIVIEVSGCAASPFDVSDSFDDPSNLTSHQASSAGVTTAANSIACVAGALNAGGGAVSPGSGYTDLLASNTSQMLWQYQVSVGGLSSEHGVWTNTPTARTAVGVIASFKAAAAASGSRRLKRRMLMGVG